MCRSIKILFNFEPSATQEEIASASLQFVRKVSGTTQPSKANAVAFDLAVEEISASISTLLAGLVTAAPSRNREIEVAKAKIRTAQRYKQ